MILFLGISRGCLAKEIEDRLGSKEDSLRFLDPCAPGPLQSETPPPLLRNQRVVLGRYVVMLLV